MALLHKECRVRCYLPYFTETKWQGFWAPSGSPGPACCMQASLDDVREQRKVVHVSEDMLSQPGLPGAIIACLSAQLDADVPQAWQVLSEALR